MVGEANKYLSDQAPWKIKDDPDRLGTILHVALQVVSDCNVLLTPFLPHSAQKHPRAAGRHRCARADAGDPGGRRPRRRARLPHHHGRLHDRRPLGVRAAARPGAPLAPPKPVFKKLDPSIVEEELARLAG